MAGSIVADAPKLDEAGTLTGDHDIWARSIVSEKKRIRGKSQVSSVDLEAAITSVKFEDTMQGSSTMTLTIRDQNWHLTDSGFFDADKDGRLDPIDVNYPVGSEQWWRLTQVGFDSTRLGSTITLTFMERAAVYMMGHHGPLKVSRAKRTRAQFLKLLCSKVEAGGGIDFHSKELNIIQPIGAGAAAGLPRSATGTVFVEGDSLAVGSNDSLRSRLGSGWTVSADAEVGRTTAEGRARLLGNDHLPKVIVVELGTNDQGISLATWRSYIDDICSHAGGSRHVVWVNLKSSTYDYGPMNDALAAKAREHGNLHVLDWEGMVNREGIDLDPDLHVHPSASGYSRRAKLIADALRDPTAPKTTKTTSQKRKAKDNGINTADKISFRFWDGTHVTLTPYQLRNAERVLDEAVRHTTAETPLLALLEACIVEAPLFNNPMGGDSSSVGILQLLDIFGSVHKRRDIAWVTEQFLTVGFAHYSGAIKTAKDHPDWTPGRVAQYVQGSAYPDRYEAVLGGAMKVLEAYGNPHSGGGGGPGQTYRKQYNFQVGTTQAPHEDFWTAANRLANEVKWPFFLDGNDAYYDSEPVLIKQRPIAVIHRGDPEVIRFSSNWDQRQIATEATLELVCNPFDFRAGEVVKLNGFGPASSGSTAGLPGRWLVSESERDLDALSTVFTLKQPQQPAPEPESQLGTRAPKKASPGGSGVHGKVVVVAGADRPGVKTRRPVIAFLELLAGRLDKTVYVTTGSNHSKMTVDGYVSDHWTGNAADLGSVKNGFAIGGKGGDKIANACAEILGLKKGQTTGSYERHIWRYATKKYSVQVLWKVSGHFDHVHVGVREA